MQMRNATVAVIGAGDYIGAAIARKFAAESSSFSRVGAMAISSRPWSQTSKHTEGVRSRAASTRAKKTR